MPDRIALSEGLLDSDSYNALDADARDLYVRLLLLADDFGCYDGREQIIASKAYPHGRAEALPLEQLHATGMAVFYLNGGRRYLAITRWREAQRLTRRFPAPPINNDLPDLTLRVKYGRKEGINWKNPRGCDDVSILLDRNWKPVSPQPPEWRNTSDWSPVTAIYARTHAGTASVSGERTQSLRAVTASPLVDTTACSVLPQLKDLELKESKIKAGADAEDLKSSSDCTQSLTTSTSTTTTNGEEKIEFKNGAFAGLTEKQRIAWQEMFDDIRIPEQMDRAAEWLRANPKDAQLYSTQENGIHAFLVRWLLREVKPKHA